MTTATPPTSRPLNMLALTEVVLLGGTATLLLAKWLRGQLSFYIHPRYVALMVVAALLLLLMAAVRARAIFSQPAGRPGWAYLLLATPLLLGTLVPARPLGADTLAGRDVELNSVGATTTRQASLGEDTTRWSLLDWSTGLTVRGTELEGRPADVVGFVFHDAQLGPDAFYVARYVVTCCAADGAGVGLPVQWAGGAALAENSWVRVRGSIASASFDGVTQPALRAEAVEPVPQPENPYLYP